MSSLTNSDTLILVDDNDQEIGSEEKEACHDGGGILHRAFSLFIFNSKNELLLQQRSNLKRLWPGYWSNSCCSHPRLGETMEQAIHRRLQEELGLKADLTYLYKFKYQAQFGDIGSEHELCSVFVGHTDDEAKANPAEIAAFRFISVDDLNNELQTKPETFTPWFKLEWQRISAEFLEKISEPVM